jgi:aryl-alcohol dehydrogenase-like predicted oxidoreductase
MDMRTRPFGSSGIEASVIGLGTWAIGGWMWGGADERASVAAIQASIDAGVSLIDTAPAYGFGRSEEIVGQAIAGRRHQVVLATKCGLVWDTQRGDHFFDAEGHEVHRYLGRESIERELDASLRRLGTDVIDIYITHWQDPTTPIAETMGALEDLRAAGKIRAIAASNVSGEDMRGYLRHGRLDGIQQRYNALDRELEDELLPICLDEGVAVMSYSSLALGILSGRIPPERVFQGDDQRASAARYSPEGRARLGAVLRQLDPICSELGVTTAQLVIAWTLARPGITYALCGARTPAHALENAKAGSLTLSGEVLTALDGVLDAARLAALA